MFSPPTLSELHSRLIRPKFDRYAALEDRLIFLLELLMLSERVPITGAAMGCRNPDDDRILETAVLGAADVIVTGDQDILVMGKVHDIPILTPRVFLAGVKLD